MTGHNHLMTRLPIAIMVDGAFFLKRYTKVYRCGKNHSPQKVADNFYKMCLKHVSGERLYRILFYDCSPLNKKAHNPISNKSINFGKSDIAIFRDSFHSELKKLRKVALRLGYLDTGNGWLIRPNRTKDLFKGKLDFNDLKETDVFYDIRQKSVDIKIGIDIASLAFKRRVDRIILISGDSDFVPAAKLARREGIDFVLDPMWASIKPSPYEHIDGLKSTCPNPNYSA